MESVQIPSPYFLQRGFSPAILTKKLVGDCWNKGKTFCGRALIPVLDEDAKEIIGITGRAINENWKPKYLHSKRFSSCNYFYNYWHAKEYIKQSKNAVIVESPTNCWRLEEAEVYNCLGLFGLSLSIEKQLLLDQLGVKNLTLILDNGEAGRKATDRIIEECSKFYNIKKINLGNFEDVAEMKVEDVKKLL